MAELTTTPTPPESTLSNQAGSNSCKSELAEGSAGVSSQIPTCPQCGSKRLWRDGFRPIFLDSLIQRWLCRNCGLRFSDPNEVQTTKNLLKHVETVQTKPLKSPFDKGTTRQICVTETKNLEPEQTNVVVPEMNKDAKGILVQFEAKMLLDGYAAETVRGNVGCLRTLLKREPTLKIQNQSN